MTNTLYTIGHSNHAMEDFLQIVQSHGITAVADVRSHPYARYATHFDQTPLSRALKRCGVEYVFLGEELGARRKEASCYLGDRVSFELVRQSPLFQQGLDRVRRGMQRFQLALMCAERDPLTCHRTLLIARTLRGELPIEHILSADEIETHADAEQRLLAHAGLPPRHLFLDQEELIEEAYTKVSAVSAYQRGDDVPADR